MCPCSPIPGRAQRLAGGSVEGAEWPTGLETGATRYSGSMWPGCSAWTNELAGVYASMEETDDC